MKNKNKIRKSLSKKIRAKLNFPLLSASPEKNIYNQSIGHNLNLSQRNSYASNSFNDSFLQRNYQNYLMKQRVNSVRLNTNILSKTDLETILFNLKKNYNLIMSITQQGNLELKTLNNNLEVEEEKLNKLIDFKEIELPEEKISLRKLGDTNMTKEQLRNHLFELLNEKRGLDEQVNIANEYTKTVEHMIVGEKKKLRKMQEETNQIQEKLKNYHKYDLLLKENLQKTKIKNNNYLDLSHQLQKNIDLANNIINSNNEKNKTLENKIINKEEGVDSLKQTIDFMKQQNKENFLKYKEDNYEKIFRTKETQEEKIKKEKKYIDIIYCLYILQKYFIEQDIFSFSYLKSSKEYNSIINDNYQIDIKDPKNEENRNSFNEKTKLIDDSNLNENSIMRKSAFTKSTKEVFRKLGKTKTYMIPNLRASKIFQAKTQNMTLNQLKDILNQINLKKEEIFDYISKLSAKISLYQYNLNNLHAKEISLNDKKHDFFDRVKKIISENFLNFEELIKNNSKFESFLYKNELFINEMKLKNRENNLNEINKRLNPQKYELEHNETGLSNMSRLTKEEKEKYEKEQKLKLNKEQMLINANESYKKANDLILKMNYFFDNILDTMNNVSNTIQNILKSGKIEKDEGQKIGLSEFFNSIEKEKEKIIEFKKINIEETKSDSSSFIDYIKKLIDYNKNNLYSKIDEKDLENKLLKSFFYQEEDINNNKINELSFNQFVSSDKISNQYDIFYHFYTMSDQTMDIIKSIISLIKNNEELINKYEAKKLSSDKSSKSILSNQNSLLASIFSSTKAKLKASSMYNKKFKLVNKQSIYDKEKNDEYDSVWVEDKDTSLETKSIKNEEKMFKKKFNHIENNIMNHLYKPSFDKTTYLRQLNLEMKNIKNLTFNNSRYNFVMNQKKNEINLMSQQMMLYNNPGIHPNDLSIPMYNNINELMIKKRQLSGKLGKRLKSTIMKKRTKYKI